MKSLSLNENNNKNIKIETNLHSKKNINTKIKEIQNANVNCITSCKKTGLKIKDYGNQYKIDPFSHLDPIKLREQEEEIKKYKSDKVYNNYEKIISQKKTFDAKSNSKSNANLKSNVNVNANVNANVNLNSNANINVNSNINYDNKTVKYELNLDLNLENYSRDELFKLFGLKNNIMLSNEILKEAKKILYKIHPDKSNLDEKYFIFFSEAYKKLEEIFNFQNKFKKEEKWVSSLETHNYYSREKSDTLNKMFENQTNLKNPENFNIWFNEQFEKYNLENKENDVGYGNWLKSDEDIIYTPQNISKDNMKREIDKVKKNIQSLTEYKGLENNYSNPGANYSSLIEYNNNYSSNMLFNNGGVGYSDLRQAYAESVIPINEDIYNNIQKYNNIQELKNHRDNMNITPLSGEEATKQLYYEEKKQNEESIALAYYYAQKNEKAKKNDELFWASLKQLTN